MDAEERIRKLSQEQEEPAWLAAYRLEAYRCCAKLSPPVFKYGKGLIVDLSSLELKDDPQRLNKVTQVAAQKDIQILSWKEAIKKNETLLRRYVFADTEGENKIMSYHAAWSNAGLFIRIPKDKHVAEPIELTRTLFTAPHLEYIFIVAEEGSNAVIKEKTWFEKASQQQLHSQKIVIVVEKGAHLEYQSLQQGKSSGYTFSQRKATVASHGMLRWIDCRIGGNVTQVLTQTTLTEEGAESTHQGMMVGTKDQLFDVYTNTIHAAPHTMSDMHTRLALNENARAIVRGLVRINKDMAGCKGHQHADALLLSKTAHVDALPILEIHNNEVQCKHGATITHLDEEDIFYLMSRGMNEDAAKDVVIAGFLNPVVEKMQEQEIKQEISRLLLQEKKRT